MAAIVLTLVLTTIIAGSTWLAIGSRLRLHSDPRQNDILYLGAYAALVLPLAFVVVFFAWEHF